MQPFAQVVEAGWGEGVVVVLPGELSLDEFFGGEGLHCLDDVKVFYFNLRMLWEIVILFGDEYSL